MTQRKFIIIGGGPAGLSAAYELLKHDHLPVVFEKLDKVGGIARTEQYRGYYFDMGGHRFYTKSSEVNRVWKETMGADFLRRPRLSRIFYNGKFFSYPLKLPNVLSGLGLIESGLIGLSFLKSQIMPHKQEHTFEEWVVNRFGDRLFRTFFKSYTEKVWGISTSELRAEWAAQRIQGLSFKTALLSMIQRPGNKIKSLIEEFDYPRRGPGMMWARFQEIVEQAGGEVHTSTDVLRVFRQGNCVTEIEIAQGGEVRRVQGSDFISSMPISELIIKLDPPAPDHVLDAARSLKYRDFLTVCLIINQKELFADNWIYIHDPSVKVGRIQNFKRWSEEMVADPNKTSLGLEYFANEGDDLWSMSDDALIELGKRELERIGLARYADVEDGCVFRVPKSYPVYDADYANYLNIIREYLETFENLNTIGRNGLHRYNNQDHAMLTGIHTVRNVLLGEQTNIWAINGEEDYLEVIEEAEQVEPIVASVQQRLVHEVSKLDSIAYAVAAGVVSGLTLFLITLSAALRPDAEIVFLLSLLGQFLPGYRISLPFSFIALLEGGLIGFILGWFYAVLQNLITRFSFVFVERRADLNILEHLDELI